MSRYLAMALVASCGLAQGAMASIPNMNALFKLTPTSDLDLWTPHKADPMTCDSASFTISFPQADLDKNGQPKWSYVIRLAGRMGGYYPVSGATTSKKFSGLDKKSRVIVWIYTYKVRKRPDGNYDWGGGRWANAYSYSNGSTPIRCTTTYPRP